MGVDESAIEAEAIQAVREFAYLGAGYNFEL
jgi:hypothetical protein